MKRLTTEWIATADEDHLLVVELGCSPKLMSCDLIFFIVSRRSYGLRCSNYNCLLRLAAGIWSPN